MILLISLARNAVFVEVTGCPCPNGIADEITRRCARSGFDAFAMIVGSTVAMRVDNPEPDGENESDRLKWDLKRALAAGLAVTWAAENKVALAIERREEPLVDGAGVFNPEGWKEVK